MSGQSLSTVVGTIVESLVRSPTFSERIQEFVCCVYERWCLDRLGRSIVLFFRKAREECMIGDPVLYMMINARGKLIVQYLETLTRVQIKNPGLLRSIEHDDTTVLNTEIKEFRAFLASHHRTTIEGISNLGFDVKNLRLHILFRQALVRSAPDRVRLHSVYMPVYLRFWDASRRLAGRPVVSIGVWCEMSTLMLNLFEPFFQHRVTLTKDEIDKAMDMALEMKVSRLIRDEQEMDEEVARLERLERECVGEDIVGDSSTLDGLGVQTVV